MSLRPRVVLCDLDDTLFDHISTTRAALGRVHAGTPELAGWSVDALDARHRELLEAFHLEVLAGRLTIEEARAARFGRLLEEGGTVVFRHRAAEVAALYREEYERAWQPVAGAVEFVRAIRRAGLKLGIVTNNVVAEQRLKLQRCGLSLFVDVLVTSEETGVSKPDPRIMEIALARLGVPAREAVVFGDSWESDIAGAQAAGIRCVWFNRHGVPAPDAGVPEVRSLEPATTALRLLLG